MGVRISWLMLARNWLLALLASSACRVRSFSAWFISRSLDWASARSVMSVRVETKWVVSPLSPLTAVTVSQAG